jgi:hypothetical protein
MLEISDACDDVNALGLPDIFSCPDFLLNKLNDSKYQLRKV